MAFTFDPTLPTERDEFRDRLDDTSETAPYYQDETIDALIEKLGLPAAMLLGVNKILLKLGKKVTSLRTAAGAQFAWNKRVEVYQDLQKQLLTEYGTYAYLDDCSSGTGNVATLPFRVEDELYLSIVPYIAEIDGPFPAITNSGYGVS